ncbi:MAG: carboxypeptidase-like regulatory protein [Bacteroidota bacterium]|nr:carboxypeptidase-like regulatory protein [Bacteroidota bacterium]
MKKILTVTVLLLLVYSEAFCQKKEVKIIQFSGYVLTADSLMGIPFAHITVMNKGRVASAGPDGFFSFATQVGDTLIFTCIGFTPVQYIVPKLDGDKFSVVQRMTKSLLYLPTTVIYPWGPRGNFPQAFKDLRLPEEQIDIAKRNLDRERLAALGEKLEHDGGEATQQALRNSSIKTYYYGQTPPQNIFNPLAWAEFIKAWKNGDFKKKSTSTDSGN